MQIANVPGSLCDEFRLFNLAVLELLLRRQLISKASHEDNQKPMVFLHFYLDQKVYNQISLDMKSKLVAGLMLFDGWGLVKSR